MKKIFITTITFFIILFGFTSIVNYSFAGDKSGSTFNNNTFQNNSFSNNNQNTQGNNKVLDGVPPPPTTDGNPIDTPVDGGISIIALGTFLLILRKKYLQNKLQTK